MFKHMASVLYIYLYYRPKTIYSTEAWGSNTPCYIPKPSEVCMCRSRGVFPAFALNRWRSRARALSLLIAPAAQLSFGNSPPEQHNPFLGWWRAGSECCSLRQGAFPNTLLPACITHWATCLARPDLTTNRKTWCAGASRMQNSSNKASILYKQVALTKHKHATLLAVCILHLGNMRESLEKANQPILQTVDAFSTQYMFGIFEQPACWWVAVLQEMTQAPVVPGGVEGWIWHWIPVWVFISNAELSSVPAGYIAGLLSSPMGWGREECRLSATERLEFGP